MTPLQEAVSRLDSIETKIISLVSELEAAQARASALESILQQVRTLLDKALAPSENLTQNSNL